MKKNYVIDGKLFSKLQEVDHALFLNARNSCSHPADIILSLGGVVEDLFKRLDCSGEDLLNLLCRFQLLTLATHYQFSAFIAAPSPKSFSSLLRLYEETGRFDLALQLTNSQAGRFSGRYEDALRRLKARHQIQDPAELLERTGGPSSWHSIPAYVINLPSDIYRLARFSARCQSIGLKFSVQPGLTPADVLSLALSFKSLPISSLDDNQRSLSTLSPRDLKELRRSGNKIAQYNVWKHMVDENISHALIFEDDAWLDCSVVDFKPSDDFSGIIFVNDRIVRHCRCRTYDIAGPLSVTNLADPANAFPCDNADIRAPGSDGYLLSCTAAKKLVSNIDENGIPVGGTDWFLLTCSLDAKLLGPGLFRDRLSYFQSRGHFDISSELRSCATSRPLAYHKPFNLFMSTR